MSFDSQRFNVIKIDKNFEERKNIADFLSKIKNVYSKNACIGIQYEYRGSLPKFWMYPAKSVPYLCKVGREKYAIVGELIINKVLDMISMPHAKYQPALLKIGQDTFFATLSPDIINGRTKTKIFGDQEEMSARSLASMYINKVRDNFHGLQANYEHTVDFYCNMLSTFDEFSRKDILNIRTELLKIALIQAITLMTDTHEENISFLRDKNGNLTVSPLFDYGSALQLDWNYTTTYNQSHYMAGTDNEQNLKKSVNKILANYKCSPKFGIHTPLIQASTEMKKQKPSNQANKLDILMKELAEEIVKNKDLQEFYYSSIKNIDFEAIQDYYSTLIDPQTNMPFIPDEFIELCKSTVQTTTYMLDKEIEKIKFADKENLLKENEMEYTK